MKCKIGNAPFGLGALLILLLAIAVVALLGMQQLSRAWQREKHTYQVLSELEALLSKLIDVEIATRGHLISGDLSSSLSNFEMATGE
jgi:CHASE3 domain sensor protein